jgi:hypothetical protein
LAQQLETSVNYYCCPPVNMIGRVVCHIIEKDDVTCLLIVPAWPSAAFWPDLQLSPRFQECIVYELRFKPRLYINKDFGKVL